MATSVQKAFRLPEDVAHELETKGNATEYVISALREKFERDEQERFRASARRVGLLAAEERDVEFAIHAQAEVAIEN